MYENCVPHEVLRNLPYEYRIPLNDMENLELVRELHDESGWCSSWGYGYNHLGMND